MQKLIFIGFLNHAGHTYEAHSTEEIISIKNQSTQKLLALKTFLKASFPLMQLSYGDTPSCSLSNNFTDLDEIRPGNFVFYDEMQTNLDTCSRNDIAVALICPIVATHPKRQEMVVHGGAIHLSKDRLTLPNGDSHYGVAVKFTDNHWQTNEVIGTVKSVSQEHGIIKLNDEYITEFHPGDLIGILPIHSCLTANLMKEYLTTEGEKIEMMV